MLSELSKLDIQLKQHRVLFFIIFFFLVGSISITGLNGSIQNLDESKYATVSRETLEEKSLVPLRDGQYYVHKSPIVYWTAMMSFKVFGVNDFAGKLPSALANILSALIVFLFVNMFFKSYTSGLLAVFIYLTSFQVYGSSHQIAADSIMVMTILASLYFSQKAFHDNKGWIFLAAFCNALTILTKSVIGLAVPVALLVYILIQKRWDCIFHYIAFFIISFGIAIPYFIYAYYKAPEIFVETFLKTNLLNRVSSDTGISLERVFKVVRHGFLYVFFMLAFVFPFTPGLFFVFRRKSMEKTLKEVIWSSHTKLLTIFFFVIWGVFSIGNRLWPHYTLSVIPIVAVYLGETLREVQDRKIFLYLAGCAFIVSLIFGVYVSMEIDQYPTYKDVVVGLFCIYAVFIALNIVFYFLKRDTNVKLLLITLIYFVIFTTTAAITVPVDFNADIKSFKEVVYNEQNPLIVINTKEVNEGNIKTGVAKWYLRMVPKEYRTMDLFIPEADLYGDGTYFIYYYKYTEKLKSIYDTFEVLKAGKVWNLGIIR